MIDREFETAVRLWKDAQSQFDTADPADAFAIDEATLRLAAAELHVRAVLDRQRRRAGKSRGPLPAVGG